MDNLIAEIKIRPFEVEDASRVSTLIRNTLLRTNIQDYPLSILRSLADYYSPEKVRRLAKERHCLVAEDQGKIIGTGAIKEDELLSVFVSPDHQKLGVGEKIVKSLEEIGSSSAFTQLKLGSSTTAVGFYQKLGYKIVETSESEHGGPQVWMRKSLT